MSCNFVSCNSVPCHSVRQFHVRHFQSTRDSRTIPNNEGRKPSTRNWFCTYFPAQPVTYTCNEGTPKLVGDHDTILSTVDGVTISKVLVKVRCITAALRYVVNFAMSARRFVQTYTSRTAWSAKCASQNSTWLVTSRFDTTRHVRPVEFKHFGYVELVKQHGSTRSSGLARHVERVVSCRDVKSQVEFRLIMFSRLRMSPHSLFTTWRRRCFTQFTRRHLGGWRGLWTPRIYDSSFLGKLYID